MTSTPRRLLLPLLALLVALTVTLAACTTHPPGRTIDKGDRIDSPEQNE